MPWAASIAAAIALLVLAVAAPTASATTDRVDYSDQVNPICASSNLQTEQLYVSLEAQENRLFNQRIRGRKQARRVIRQFRRLENQLPFQVIAIYRAELAQLKAVAPPPGYEDVVARWLPVREELLNLDVQYLQFQQELDRVPARPRGKRPSRKARKRRVKRAERLENLSDQIEERLEADAKLNLELGAKLGAAYCVTGATGNLTPIHVFND
jgi:hypothetical protein